MIRTRYDVGCVTYLDADRVSDTLEELNMCLVKLPRALAAPYEVGRAIVVEA